MNTPIEARDPLGDPTREDGGLSEVAGAGELKDAWQPLVEALRPWLAAQKEKGRRDVAGAVVAGVLGDY